MKGAWKEGRGREGLGGKGGDEWRRGGEGEQVGVPSSEILINELE
jgi:hypothetical protein